MARRLLHAWSATLVLAASSLAACSFPDVTIDDRLDEVGVGDTSIPSDAESDGASVADGADASDVADTQALDTGGGDGTSADTRDAADSGDAGDASPTCTRACDCDDDTDKANGATCGGLDCDDNDPRANSKITAFDSVDLPIAPTNGDWNCNKTVEKQYPINVSCTKLALGGCDGQQGFSGDPGCATSGTYVFCKTNLAIGCVEDHSETRTQGCK